MIGQDSFVMFFHDVESYGTVFLKFQGLKILFLFLKTLYIPRTAQVDALIDSFEIMQVDENTKIIDEGERCKFTFKGTYNVGLTCKKNIKI